MLDELRDVKDNPFLNSLNHVAENFGLYSYYVKYNSSTDETVNSVYFIVGNNKNEVEKQVRNIENMCLALEKDIDFLHTDCAVFELTDNPPFATHQSIVDFCRHAEFTREVFKDHNAEVPSKINKRFLFYLTNLYREKEINGKDSMYQILYENAFHKYLSLEDKINSDDYETRRKAELELYDLIEKTTVRSFFKSILDKELYPNFYPLEEVSRRSGTLVKHKTKAKYLKPLSEKLKNRPDVVCWHSAIEKQPSAIMNEELGIFKSKEKDDDAIVSLRYPTYDAQIITKMLAEIAYPEITEVNVEEIMKDDKYISCAIRELDLKFFKALCDKNNVKFGFNPNRIYHTGVTGPFSVVINEKDEHKLDEILKYMAKEKEKFHSHNLGLPYSNVKEMFEIADLSDFGLDER